MSTPLQSRTAVENRIATNLFMALLTAHSNRDDVAETAALDQIRAHLAGPEWRERAAWLFAAAVSSATGCMLRTAEKSRNGDEPVWGVTVNVGLHRRDPAGYRVAVEALRAAVPAYHTQARARDVLATQLDALTDRATALSLVTEAVWLTAATLNAQTQ